MKILTCDNIICDRPLSHMGQEYPFLWLSEIFSVSACLSHPRIKFCLKLSIIANMSCLMINQQNCMCAQRILRSACKGNHPVSSESSLSTERNLGSLVSSYPLDAQRRLWSDWADAQTDLSLGWARSHFVGFVMKRPIYQTPQQRWLPISVTSRITTGTEGMQLLGSLLIYRCSTTTSTTYVLGLQLHL